MNSSRLTNKKIVFDAFELVYGYGKSLGIYRYAVNMFRELANTIPDGYDLIVITNSLNNSDFLHSDSRRCYSVNCIEIKRMSAGKKIGWQWFGVSRMMKKFGADIYYSPKGFAPGFLFKPGSYKILLTTHDLIPVWYAENGMSGGLTERYVVRSLLRSAKWADAIMTVSETTKSNIVKYTGREHNVTVVNNGMDAPIDVESDNHPHDSKYIFALGSQLAHKNTELLLKGYRKYLEKASDPLPLVICGNGEMPLGVIVVRRPSDRELAAWYYHAECFIFPSLIEGFGFPPLEAMQYSTPVIASDTPIQREILGDACIYFNPYDSDELATKLVNLLSDNVFSQELAEAGRKRCKMYNWQSSAKKAWEIIKKIG